MSSGREGGSSRILQVIDTLAKLATPAAVIVAAWVGARLANSFQDRMTQTTLNSQRQIAGTTLLSEREKAESELRATMFNSLINPFIGSQNGERISVDREQLLVELLALNFHEHFELKPLFERIDKRLAGEGSQEARNALRSIADRIIDRQTAALSKEGSSNSPNGEGARIDMLTIAEPPLDPRQKAVFTSLAANEQRPFQVVGTLKEPIEDLRSPDGAQKVTIVVEDADWANQMFKVQLLAIGTKSGSVNSNTAFTLSRFDFPLTDNTLFSDGNRIALAVSSIRVVGGLKSVAIKLIWFPKNYFTPRERPLDNDEFLKLVGKNT
ncbi:MAG: hypothetical protein KGL31_10305 [candidate division NC10 bacterium]|nr:hypothetical protein [candidate division NC10 bacterium]MDE2322290.1 hypothetical protein [candidate division NC10 bacterium]